MNKQTEALRMLFDAVDKYRWAVGNDATQSAWQNVCDLLDVEVVEALEQPAQEPYGWIYEERIDDPEHPDGYYYSWGFSWIEIGSGKPVYTHPTPSWQGLSDDEILPLAEKYLYDKKYNDVIIFARAIEKGLKEKNHG